MTLRRLIAILCIVAILPTTVDPSCIGYFMYSNAGLSVVLGESFDEETISEPSKSVESSGRPAEGLAATRIPSQISIAPQAIVDDLLRLLAIAPADGVSRDIGSTPDHLAPAWRHTFLRHSVLLI